MSIRMRDLVGMDVMLADLSHRGTPPVPIVRRIDDDDASGAEVRPPISIPSAPSEPDVSDHYRHSSPNRNRGRDDGTMRHRRNRR